MMNEAEDRTISLPIGAVRAGLRNWSQRFRPGLLDLLYPPACAGCGAEIAGRVEVPICTSCIDQLPLLRGASCQKCGSAVPGQESRTECYLCRGTKLWFDEAISLGRYEGRLRDWLLRMKTESGDNLTIAMANLLCQQRRSQLEAWRPDVVVPVPMHWRRRWKHGTNSAAVLAEQLAHRLGVPFEGALLRRVRNTPPQFSLPASQRKANVRKAFAMGVGYHLRSARVLLVDDILTTGSTCSTASRVLKQHGAEFVGVVLVARAGNP